MRLQHWMIPAMAMLVALTSSRPASAQYDPTYVVPADAPQFAAQPAPFPYYDAAANGGILQAGYQEPVAPPMVAPLQGSNEFVPPYVATQASPLLINPPASAQYPEPGLYPPWPQISPYDHRFQEHSREDGLWFQRTNDEADRHVFTADVIFPRFRRPHNGFIGAPDSIIPDPLISGTRDVFDEFTFSVGLRLGLELIRPDDSGFNLEGFWTGQNDDTERFDLTSLQGQYNYEIQAAGVDLERTYTPFIRGDSYQIQHLVGLRYLGINEDFNFYSANGGLSQTSLLSTTKTSLGGPEIGLLFEAGGDSVLMRAKSTVGLMANHETIHLEGAGNGYSHFVTNRSHTHVSPLFEQTINFDAAVFEVLPLLKHVQLLEHARLSVGYTFLVVGEVVRPTDTIVYNPFPTDPGISVNRTYWFMNSWNVGVEWRR